MDFRARGGMIRLMDTLQTTAEARVRFLLWLADRLEQSEAKEYRIEAAKALRQLVGVVQP